MLRQHIRSLILLIILPFLFLSCQSAIYSVAYPTLDDGKYDSEFPYKSSSDQLEEITQSIKMLNTIAYYTAYIFDSDEKFLRTDMNEEAMEDRAIETGSFTQTASGTATIICEDNGSVVLLTCAHIIDFPDTIISYFKDEDGYNSDYIQSISVKVRQANYIPEFPRGGEIDIITMDRKEDLALLGRHFGPSYSKAFKIFAYPSGSAKELEWGSFVYTIGFPMNYKMISKAIVSSPNRDRDGSFLIDAVFNKGFSGGLVLAIRDGVPNFELVGLVNTVPAYKEYVLSPDHKFLADQYNPVIPYQGEMYLKQLTNIRYGITKIISIESILDFVDDQNDFMKEKGYDLYEFIEREKEEKE